METNDQKALFIKAIYFNKETGECVYNSQSVEEILLQKTLSEKHVALISVAGAFRRGKSFLLNFFIRYLKHVQKNGFSDNNDWLGHPEDPLIGFPWRGGSERETDGILLWREPFLIKIPSGEEIVVLLMDTQGTFDSNSTVKECATVFAISTMISSVQIYNISSNLQEDYLSHLHLFTEYGRIALETSGSKPFQDLLFLIRDWSFPYEYEYGYAPEFLEKKLTLSEVQPEELQSVRQHIKDCFETVNLFLLPHPGIKVATTPNFNGALENIDDTFKVYLGKLVSSILSPETIKPKVSQGIPIRCSDLLTFFDSYVKVFQSHTLPEPKSMLLATAEANNLVALNSAKQLYFDNMKEVDIFRLISKICGADKPYIPVGVFNSKHALLFDASIHHFIQCKKFGGDVFMNQYRDRLENELNERYQEFFKINNNKQVNSFKFIITAFIICGISFLFSQFLDVVGLDVFMMPFNALSVISLLLILFCCYAQFYGGFAQILYYLNLIPDILTIKIQQIFLHKYLDIKKYE